MADSIDLDEMDVEEPDEESEANHGDWLWRGEGDPEDEPEPVWSSSEREPADEGPEEPIDGPGGGTDEAGETSDDGAETQEDEGPEDTSETSGSGPESSERPPGIPRIPTGPVGLPAEQGGAGAGSSSGGDSAAEPSESTSSSADDTGAASEMTLAITYEALNRLSDPRFVIADARGWADWIGVVGKVSTPAIKGFQRREGLEIDFFGGSEDGPERRLADVTPETMFYAERMVLVGAVSDEPIAEAAGWEFVPLAEAAEKAGWTIEHEE
ncbi:DUF7124 domain-containing protein [Natronorarus salvus]|uniref:DUF7124 domain-containing protein n=1 Tax=Natronorarus salvus TaxID=3117733 RepID=UPI002F2647EA